MMDFIYHGNGLWRDFRRFFEREYVNFGCALLRQTLDKPVASFVGLGQRAAAHPPSNPHVIEILGTRTLEKIVRDVLHELDENKLSGVRPPSLIPSGN